MNAVVIDDWAPRELLSAADATWPADTSGLWHVYESGKRATKSPHGLPRAAQLLIDRMAAMPIGELFGISESFPDVEWLHGAGLHEMRAGHSLGLHLDAERHPLLPWSRVASAVLYLDDVTDSGCLELCDASGNVVESVESRRGRLVLFATPGQWHRVSECGSRRRSICLFWWRIAAGASGATQATFAG